jgi:ATP-dependent Clp protease ATP-binding subunit ClpA
MARLIQSKIKEPLASEILFGSLVEGGHVTIEELNDDLHLKFEQLAATESAKELG